MHWKSILIKGIFVCTLNLVAAFCYAQQESQIEKLISHLGCANCHTSLKIESKLREKIPNLSYAGLRYNPAYLFDFFQNPLKIRRHIGISRMVDFHFDEEEALALTFFLETQKQVGAFLPEYPNELTNSTNNQNNSKTKSQLIIPVIEDTLCLTCHSLQGKGGVFAVDLSTVSYRLKSGWVKKYLVAPSVFGVPSTTMPNAFYHLSENKKVFVKNFPDAADQINQLSEHLFSLNKSTKYQLEKIYQRAKESNPNLTAEIGKKIFRSQNCTGCHKHHTISPSREIHAPDLTIEGFRVHQEWLSVFLTKPFPIRPFGFQPGSGSRMPDFKLSDGMVKTLTSFFMNQKAGKEIQIEVYFPQQLTAFSKQKAHLLFQDKLSCLGCHRLGDLGGRIGPDLSSIGQRLNPFYLFNQIKNPAAFSQKSIMPQIPLPPKTLKLIFNYLVQQNMPQDSLSYFSLIENPPTIFLQQSASEINYLKYCAICHGGNGDGDGYNAKFLTKKPTVHSDSTHMSKRPDNTLFDGVHAGGYILNKSHFMPPWGQTLSYEGIDELVNYMRQLCGCQGPEWSLDNKKVN